MTRLIITHYLASLAGVLKLVVLDILPGLPGTRNDNRSGRAGMGQKEMIREIGGHWHKCAKPLNFLPIK